METFIIITSTIGKFENLADKSVAPWIDSRFAIMWSKLSTKKYSSIGKATSSSMRASSSRKESVKKERKLVLSIVPQSLKW